MEAVASGASVLAFIAIALKSTKAVYQIVSGIKDGPAQVQRLASTLQGLLGTLEQLSKSKAFTESDSGLDLVEIEWLVKRCSEDMISFDGKLKRLGTSSTRGLGNVWKKVKIVLQEKDLEHMWTVVQGHFDILGARLSLFQM